MKPEELGEQRDAIEAGVGATTLLRVLGPLAKRRLNTLLAQLSAAAPELNVLLDLRAQITEVMRITNELEKLAAKGREAAETINDIFSV